VSIPLFVFFRFCLSCVAGRRILLHFASANEQIAISQKVLAMFVVELIHLELSNVAKSCVVQDTWSVFSICHQLSLIQSNVAGDAAITGVKFRSCWQWQFGLPQRNKVQATQCRRSNDVLVWNEFLARQCNFVENWVPKPPAPESTAPLHTDEADTADVIGRCLGNQMA